MKMNVNHVLMGFILKEINVYNVHLNLKIAQVKMLDYYVKEIIEVKVYLIVNVWMVFMMII